MNKMDGFREVLSGLLVPIAEGSFIAPSPTTMASVLGVSKSLLYSPTALGGNYDDKIATVSGLQWAGEGSVWSPPNQAATHSAPEFVPSVVPVDLLDNMNTSALVQIVARAGQILKQRI